MGKFYVHPGEIATIKQGTHYIQIDPNAIRRIVWEKARLLPVDEVEISPGQWIGYDEDGAYIKYG